MPRPDWDDQRVRPPAALVAARARPAHPGRRTRARRATASTTDDAQVTVVDLHNLHDRAKRFVVGVTLRRAFDDKEQTGSAKPLLFVVLDELNKYAPRDGESPIKEILLDVAERGRSLGIILIGAQQTASEVERRIIANSSIRVVGRLDPAEAPRPEYGFLPTTHRKRATIAKPGTMFVTQPEIPVPLVVEFPFPAWATRPSETAGRSDRDRRGRRCPTTRSPACSAAATCRVGRVRILHTSDWHVGKTLRGVSRLDEHRAVLAEIADIAARERSTSSSSPATCSRPPRRRPRRRRSCGTRCSRCAPTARAVVVIGGNHDNQYALDAVAPVFAAAGITVLGHATRPEHGGVVRFTTDAGEPVVLVLVPFVSQRFAIRAEQMLDLNAAGAADLYATRMRRLIDALAEGFDARRRSTSLPRTASCYGGRLGGGERDAQTIFDYGIEAAHFPAGANYVALGHLHRTQKIPAPAPAWYAGSPIQVDFGEEADAKHVLVVDTAPGVPAKVTERALATPWAAAHPAAAPSTSSSAATDRIGDAWLRVVRARTDSRRTRRRRARDPAASSRRQGRATEDDGDDDRRGTARRVRRRGGVARRTSCSPSTSRARASRIRASSACSNSCTTTPPPRRSPDAAGPPARRGLRGFP